MVHRLYDLGYLDEAWPRQVSTLIH
jgi:hypothetical protein